jgi:hypothetical protein
MFRKIIEECFGNLKTETPSDAKKIFGYIWGVFASKRVRFNDDSIWMSWRELSAELAIIYNEWFDAKFTTDAFLRTHNPDKPVGEDSAYDDVLMQVYRHTNCIGIFKMKSGPSIRSRDTVGVFSEIDIVTAEEHYYKQEYKKGNRVGNPERISATTYESLCFSLR